MDRGVGRRLARVDVPVYVVPAPVLAHVTGYEVHRGALASLQRRVLPSSDDLLARSRRVLLLEDLNDPTNLGAIFRSAAALGMDAILLTPRCADPLYRRSVRVSMGAVLHCRTRVSTTGRTVSPTGEVDSGCLP